MKLMIIICSIKCTPKKLVVDVISSLALASTITHTQKIQMLVYDYFPYTDINRTNDDSHKVMWPAIGCCKQLG